MSRRKETESSSVNWLHGPIVSHRIPYTVLVLPRALCKQPKSIYITYAYVFNCFDKAYSHGKIMTQHFALAIDIILAFFSSTILPY